MTMHVLLKQASENTQTMNIFSFAPLDKQHQLQIFFEIKNTKIFESEQQTDKFQKIENNISTICRKMFNEGKKTQSKG